MMAPTSRQGIASCAASNWSEGACAGNPVESRSHSPTMTVASPAHGKGHPLTAPAQLRGALNLVRPYSRMQGSNTSAQGSPDRSACVHHSAKKRRQTPGGKFNALFRRSTANKSSAAADGAAGARKAYMRNAAGDAAYSSSKGGPCIASFVVSEIGHK